MGVDKEDKDEKKGGKANKEVFPGEDKICD